MGKLFTYQAIKNLKQTGSLFSSSKILARKISSSLPIDNDLKVLEFGAGNGIITKHILQQVTRNSQLDSFEINPTFLEKLKAINDNRLTIYNTCVSTITEQYDEASIDYIISSLPLANFKKPFKIELLHNIKTVLKTDGIFIQYQYSPYDYKLLKSNFKDLSLNFCFKNIPPAIIYTCNK